MNDCQTPRVLPGASVLPSMEAPEPQPSKGTSKNKRYSGDRFSVVNNFVDSSMAGLTKSELATWVILWRDTRNGIARTSQADIARRAGLSKRSIHSAIKGLVKAGLLKIVHKGSLNSGPSCYRVMPQRK